MAEDQGRGVDAEAKKYLTLLYNDAVVRGTVRRLTVTEDVYPGTGLRRVRLDIEFTEDDPRPDGVVLCPSN